jgi:RNA polymerase sigma-70 factor (ECF subfamily)
MRFPGTRRRPRGLTIQASPEEGGAGPAEEEGARPGLAEARSPGIGPGAPGGAGSPGPLPAERVVEEHADLVFSLARRLARDEEEARELFQESFVRILRGLPDFEGRSSLRTWICQVVINCDRNRRRFFGRLRRNLPSIPLPREGEGDEGPPALDVADPAAGPDRLVLGGELRARIETSLRELPREQRTAVLLRDVEGLSYEEIAAALGRPLGTVKSKIARARAALRLSLADLVEPPAGEGSR